MAERTAEQEYVLVLVDPRAADVAVTGGKGASLARLSAAGLPVPAGFAVTTAAYRRFVDENDLEPAIRAALEPVDAARPATLEAASRTLRDLLTGQHLPDAVTEAVGEAYAALGEGAAAVAVRSSATAEDLPSASFAGQQETYLNIRGEEALLDAVRRCWASLWTDRAIAYRLAMGVDRASVSMAVVVQLLVPSEVSGVLFTANPTTGARDELVVNASYGLGEAVASGQVTPDDLLVDRASLALKEAVVGEKAVSVLPAGEHGTVTETVPEHRRKELALPGPRLRELAELALRVERESGGGPQDVEWAVAGGRCWLLQARPMTGLPPAPLEDVRWESPVPGEKWVRRQVVENMPEPLSPLFDELYLRAGMKLAMDRTMEMLGYSDIVADTGVPPFVTVNGYAYLHGSTTVNWGGLLRSLPALLGGKPVRVAFGRSVPYWRDEVLPAHLATVERWRGLDVATAPDELLLEGMRELARSEAVYWGATTLVLAAAKNSDLLLGRLLSTALPRRGLRSAVLLRGFASRALQAEAQLQAVAEQVRARPELRELVASTPAHRLLDALRAHPGGGAVVEGIQGYLDRYGHQVYTLDFAEPTQAENPLPVLLSLKAQVEGGTDVVARRAQLVREREHLVERTAASLDPLRRRLFVRTLRWAQRYAPYREDALFHLGSAWPAFRRLALELGRRLVDAGSLAAPGDVFYLETGELLAAAEARAAGRARPDLAALAGERHELREARRRLHPPAAVPPAARMKFGPFDISFAETQRRNDAEGPTLRGFPVSPGRVTGPASVILSPADLDRMTPGTVLVCPTTNPAWTPLFTQATGLVTDIGGVAAHGSVVAREYGIPAVMGTGTGTRRITTGQRVTVDGDAGTVTLLDEGAPGPGEAPSSRT